MAVDSRKVHESLDTECPPKALEAGILYILIYVHVISCNKFLPLYVTNPIQFPKALLQGLMSPQLGCIQGQNALRFYKEVACDDEFNGFVLDNQEPLL